MLMEQENPDQLGTLMQRIRAFNKSRDWAQFHNPKDLAISLSLEASELLEHFQWKDDAEMKAHLENRKSEVASELADVFYWTLLMGDYFDIDLIDASNAKMDQNEAKYPIGQARGNSAKYTELS
jgi:dCTP diphosphatase